MKRIIVFFLCVSLAILMLGVPPIVAADQWMIETPFQDGATYHSRNLTQQTQVTTRSGCEKTIELVYAAALRRLNSRPPASEQQLREAINMALGRDMKTSWDLVVLRIEPGPRPSWFIGFTCGLSVTQAYSSFRIFKAFGDQYQSAVTSEQFAVLKAFDKLEIPISHATLEARLLQSRDSKDRTYIFTDWVRAAMSPAPGSMFIWEWDGQQLRLVWQLIGFQYGTVKVVDHLLLLNRPDVSPEQLDPVTARQAKRYVEVYRLQGGSVMKDGLLNSELAERYLREGLIRATDPDSLMELAYMLETAGDKEGAVSLHEQVVALDPKRPLSYMSLSRLYEELKQYAKAAEYMERLASAMGGLSQDGERRLKELQRKANEQRKP